MSSKKISNGIFRILNQIFSINSYCWRNNFTLHKNEVFSFKDSFSKSTRNRSNQRRCSVKKGVKPATLLKRDFNTGVFLRHLRNF